MAYHRNWQAYHPTYRAEQVKMLAGWISAGTSVSVVGQGGAGKSNLLGFVCHRPGVVQSYLPPKSDPVALIPVDLNNLPSSTLATFYRVILRSFYEIRQQFSPALQQEVADLYLENRATRDPFLAQSALRELIGRFREKGVRVVLVLDHFDRFCRAATPQMANTLRGMRDSFKGTLSYIVGMRQEVAYLSGLGVLEELHETLDIYVCWVGPMNKEDARRLIAEETFLSPAPPGKDEVARLLSLTGGYPSLLKAACQWWWLMVGGAPLPLAQWAEALLAERSIQQRLGEIWEGLTQEEQLVLSEVQRLQVTGKSDRVFRGLAKQYDRSLARLKARGLLNDWCIFSDLFAAYVATVQERGRGTIWLDKETGELCQGQALLSSLTPLEREALCFFVSHPKTRHSKRDLIDNVWPDTVVKEGVTDDALYQVIRGLRIKIEPNPSKPCYVTTVRGGYQCFPEGRSG